MVRPVENISYQTQPSMLFNNTHKNPIELTTLPIITTLGNQARNVGDRAAPACATCWAICLAGPQAPYCAALCAAMCCSPLLATS